MHTSPPDTPRYGSVIELARKGAGLSMQRAADAAGISKATWIDSTRGYRRRGAEWETVEPKPETIARMARAVGISPERLKTEGQHPEAAEILAEIQRTQPALQRPAAPRPALRDTGGIPVVSADPAELAPYIEQVWAEVAAAKAFHGPHPAGEQVFPADPDEARMWDREVLTEPERVRLVAFIRMMAGRTQTNGGRKAS